MEDLKYTYVSSLDHKSLLCYTTINKDTSHPVMTCYDEIVAKQFTEHINKIADKE